MRFLKTKIVLFIVLILSIIFFSNDFGLVDIEQTAIITALALDYENGEYSLTAQIAVPEATDVNAENTKTQITTKGDTVASAIKHIGASTGWFPQLYFCNLIILGNELSKENTIKTLDYFSYSLRVQDSTLVVLAESKAKDVLKYISPLDSISSFAIQKVILKESGFDNDIMIKNVKDFTSDFYSRSNASFMPIVKGIEQKEASSGGSSAGCSGSSSGSGGGGSGGQGGSSGEDKKYVFDSTTTALFADGVKVGELEKDLTFAYNLIHSDCSGSEIVLKDVELDGEKKNYLTLVEKNKRKCYLTTDNNTLIYNIHLNLKLKVSDETSTHPDSYFIKNKLIDDRLKPFMTKQVENNLNKLIEKEKETKCDFLKLKDELYRFKTDDYFKYKDCLFRDLHTNIVVEIE